jgi:hypothetical protein
MNFTFFKDEKIGLREQVTFVGSTMEIYIPSYFLNQEENMASIISDKIESLGLFWFKVDKKLYELQLPIKIMFEFSESYKETLRLKPNMPSMDYDVFVLKNGDAFVYDKNHKQSLDDLTWFISKIIEGAKLPPTVSYDEVVSLFARSLEITTIYSRLGVPLLTIEFILSELFRERKNTSNPYRLVYDGKRLSPYDYKMIRIVKVPEMNSTFTGMIGEDIKQQLVSGILKNRLNKKERISPIEKVMKY